MQEFNIQISKKYNIPCTYCGDITQTSKVVLHLNSANTNNTIINYFHIPKEKNYCFVCPNLPGNSFESKYSSLSNNNSYIKIIVKIINKIKEIYPNVKQVYLSGESWGANLAILFCHKHHNLISGIVCWNAPNWIVQTEDLSKTRESTWSVGIKHIITLLTNINFKARVGDLSGLTDNKIFERIYNVALSKRNYINCDVRIDIAVFKSMFFTYRYLKKHFKKNIQTPLIYIQTKNDAYYCRNIKKLQKIAKYQKQPNEIIFCENGYHMLTYDMKGNDKVIWDNLDKLTK